MAVDVILLQNYYNVPNLGGSLYFCLFSGPDYNSLVKGPKEQLSSGRASLPVPSDQWAGTQWSSEEGLGD